MVSTGESEGDQSRGACSNPSLHTATGADRDILEVVVAHLTIKRVALHALETPIRKVLAWIVELARAFTVAKLAA